MAHFLPVSLTVAAWVSFPVGVGEASLAPCWGEQQALGLGVSRTYGRTRARGIRGHRPERDRNRGLPRPWSGSWAGPTRARGEDLQVAEGPSWAFLGPYHPLALLRGHAGSTRAGGHTAPRS